jgi:hypothetical protein
MGCEWLPDLQALIQYHNPAIICFQEIHLCLSLALKLNGYTAHHYDHPDSRRADGGMAIIVKDSIYCILVNLCSSLWVIAVHLHLPSLHCTLCNVYLPPAVTVCTTNLTNLISQLPSPFTILSNFNAKNILSSAVLTDGREGQFMVYALGLI